MAEVNASLTGGQIDPATFLPGEVNASSFSFSIIPNRNATEINFALPEASANYFGEPTLGVNFQIKIVPDVLDKDKLLNWWWFDEAVANKVGDGIGDENGTLVGDATWSSDAMFGTSVTFQNSGDMVDLGLTDSNFSGGRFSLSFWFKRTEESFNWSSNLVSNVMVSLGDENGSVLEVGSKNRTASTSTCPLK